MTQVDSKSPVVVVQKTPPPPRGGRDRAAMEEAAALADGSLIARRLRPGLMILTLALSDLLCLGAAMLAALYGRWIFGGQYDPMLYLRLWPILGVFLLAYAAMRLYPSAPLSGPEELRRLTVTTSLIFIGLGASTFLTREIEVYSRGVLLIGWALSVVMVVSGRGVVRLLLARQPWWGYSAVVVGDGDAASSLVNKLQRQPEIGLKPVAVLRTRPGVGRYVHDVPVVSTPDRVDRLVKKYRIAYAIVCLGDVEDEDARRLLRRYARTFPHLMVLPQLDGLSSLWVAAVDIHGTLGLEVRHRLLDGRRRIIKRTLEVALLILLTPVVLPLLAVIAALVHLDSGRPIFYRHERIGEQGRRFRVWKFRTMVPDADAILQDYMNDPALQAQWNKTQKLRDDPRVTRVGRFLRRTSLDELPQILNVLAGQMSLVGPRPIVDNEVARYGDSFELIEQVRPGITGMWQVSGRNLLSYRQRVELDIYYVRNWSVWLDIYILGRTALAVLLRRGAF